MVAITGKSEVFLGNPNGAKSFTAITAFSPHNDPLSLECWIIGRVLDEFKGRMTGVF